MSMGFLIDETSPVVWRGLMVMSALDRLIREVAWGPLDYMIIDTPPGTGDILLSLVQNLPISGVLIVTTPQKVALDVARRGAKMFEKLKIPIFGIVENMTSVTCPKCDHEVLLFGEGATNLAAELGKLSQIINVNLKNTKKNRLPKIISRFYFHDNNCRNLLLIIIYFLKLCWGNTVHFFLIYLKLPIFL